MTDTPSMLSIYVGSAAGRDPQTPTTAGYQWDRNSREHGSSTDLGKLR